MAMSGTADSIERIRNNGETSIQDIVIEDGTSGMDPISLFNFDLDSPPTLISNAKRNNDEIMQWHIRLNHLPFSKLRLMASMGMIPKRLSKTSNDNTPICASYLYGKATRKLWKNKGKYKPIKPAKVPGECVSVDSFESSTKGLIGQIKGRLMWARYMAATVFVDHFSGLLYVHMQRDQTSAELMKSKMAFENFAETHGVTNGPRRYRRTFGHIRYE